MLEWTHRKLQNKSQSFSSLADAYDDLLYEYKDENNSNIKHDKLITSQDTPQSPSIDNMKAELLPLLAVLGLSNITLKLYPLINTEETHIKYEQYRHNIPTFLRLIGENCSEECRNCGMSDKAISLLCQEVCPENYTPHLKIPFNFGGMANLSNFSLVKTHPTHDNLHQIIDIQLENNFTFERGQIWLPMFQGKIYNG